MKKRKIAIFANGWSDDYLTFAFEGARKRASEDNIDLMIFLDYTAYDATKVYEAGETNILNLPDLSDFDGVLLLGNTLNNGGENAILREKLLKCKVPSICLEYALEDINSIRTDNVSGMKELVEHLIGVHDVKDVFWVSGPLDNSESNERFQALVETMEAHGLSVDPSKQFEGFWSYAIVEENIPGILAGLERLPDAFVCANDSMALAVCAGLDKAGIRVPQDVLVTGFDNLESGNHFSPILTSVDRGWEARSYQAVGSLIELMDGAPDFGDRVYNSTFDLGESCGCSMGEKGLKLQQDARRRAFLIPVERTIFDWHLIDIDESLSTIKTLDAMHGAFEDLFEHEHSYEGDDFYICLDKRFVGSMTNNASGAFEGYSDEIEVIYGMEGGRTVAGHSISVRDLIPRYDPCSEETAVYLFFPLHVEAECLGYYVCKDHMGLIKDFYSNSLIRHLASGLGRARQNILLENLNKLLSDISIKDELTGLYNRMGYEKVAIPYLDELRLGGRESVIVVVDINRMKVINDRFGHLQGDMAIRTVADAIKSSIPEEWKAVRYGGDEYVIIGEYTASSDMETVKKEIIDKAAELSVEQGLPFRLSISAGYVIIKPGNDIRNDEYFRMADEAMYEMKEEAHKREGT